MKMKLSDLRAAPDETPQILYIVEGGGLIKIGNTRSLRKRMSDFLCSSPVPITLVYQQDFPLSMCLYLEAATHAALNHLRHHGEWFDCDPEHAINTILNLWGRRVLNHGNRIPGADHVNVIAKGPF